MCSFFKLTSHAKTSINDQHELRRQKGKLKTHLAALDELLLGPLVLIGGGGVLRCGDGLSGSCCCLLGCILSGKRAETHQSPTHLGMTELDEMLCEHLS